MKTMNRFSRVFIPLCVEKLDPIKFSSLMEHIERLKNRSNEYDDRPEITKDVMELFFDSYLKILMVTRSQLSNSEKYYLIIELLNEIYFIPSIIKHKQPLLFDGKYQTAFMEHTGTQIDKLFPPDLSDSYAGDLFRTIRWKERVRPFVSEFINWGLPSDECFDKIKTLVGSKTILEIGSGWGFWAMMLRLKGCDVIATDDYSWMKVCIEEKKFTNVEQIASADVFSQNRSEINNAEVLLLVWPEYKSPMAYDALRYFKGDLVIYVGEDEDGCTGCENFHDMLKEDWEIAGPSPKRPQWIYTNDSVFFYKRRT